MKYGRNVHKYVRRETEKNKVKIRENPGNTGDLATLPSGNTITFM